MPTISFYVNGSLVDQPVELAQYTGWSGTDLMGLGATAGVLGGNKGGNTLSNYGNFVGEIAALRIYSAALTAGEIQGLYNNARLTQLVNYDAQLDNDVNLTWHNATNATGMDLSVAGGSENQGVTSAVFPQLTMRGDLATAPSMALAA